MSKRDAVETDKTLPGDLASESAGVGQSELREAERAEERCSLGKIRVSARRKTVVEFSAHRGECEAELFERKVAELRFRAAPELLNKTKWMSAEDRRLMRSRCGFLR
jgi:hypothetical protein